MSETHTFTVRLKVHVSADEFATRQDALQFLMDAQHTAKHHGLFSGSPRGTRLTLNDRYIGQATIVTIQ